MYLAYATDYGPYRHRTYPLSTTPPRAIALEAGSSIVLPFGSRAFDRLKSHIVLTAGCSSLPRLNSWEGGAERLIRILRMR